MSQLNVLKTVYENQRLAKTEINVGKVFDQET